MCWRDHNGETSSYKQFPLNKLNVSGSVTFLFFVDASRIRICKCNKKGYLIIMLQVPRMLRPFVVNFLLLLSSLSMVRAVNGGVTTFDFLGSVRDAGHLLTDCSHVRVHDYAVEHTNGNPQTGNYTHLILTIKHPPVRHAV